MKRAILTLTIFFFMAATINLYSQAKFESDIIKTSKGDLEMFFIGHGTLMFVIDDYVIHIDPVSDYADYATLPKADLVVVSHSHGDHFDIDAINAIRKSETVLYTVSDVASQVSWAKSLKYGDIIKDFANFTIEAIPAYNIEHLNNGRPYHSKENSVGFVFDFGDKRVYVGGDTENTPEMKALKNIDVAFLPMNLPFTMSPEQVADAAKAFKPTILYPYHFGNSSTEELIKLMNGSGIEIRIRKLQ